MRITTAICLLMCIAISEPVVAQWRAVSDSDSHQKLPEKFPSGGKEYKVGDVWPQDQRFRWLIADLEIPEMIKGQPTAGKSIGLQFNCGDGGEVYVAGRLQCRYDNDRPALVTLTNKASLKQKV